MLRRLQYRSVLPPEQAKRKTWIGAQFGQLLSPHKTIRSLAERLIECKGNDNALRVFDNKVIGDVHSPKVERVDPESLRKLIVVKRRDSDPEFYLRGQVPPAVRFLTAGQDSRSTELHYCVWGWGLRRASDQTVSLCGWLIDWGVIERKYSLTFSESEYHAFDDILYRRTFSSSVSDRTYNVRRCGHDVGYAPTQIPIHAYCRNWKDRAFPAKGAALEPSSASLAPYYRLGSALKFELGDIKVTDESSRPLIFNTYTLKNDMLGWMSEGKKIEILDKVNEEVIGVRKVNIITLPEDVDDEWIKQSSSEYLGKGKKSSELVYKHDGPNHFSDCNTQAYGCALSLEPFQKGMTAEESAKPPRARPIPRDVRRESYETS